MLKLIKGKILHVFMGFLFFSIASHALAYTQQDLIDANRAVADAQSNYDNHYWGYASLQQQLNQINQDYTHQQFLCNNSPMMDPWARVECIDSAYDEHMKKLQDFQDAESQFYDALYQLEVAIDDARARYDEIYQALYP
jgi:DNA repair exonuclease SbcCD ATPase subunit